MLLIRKHFSPTAKHRFVLRHNHHKNTAKKLSVPKIAFAIAAFSNRKFQIASLGHFLRGIERS